jgi:hypothetical protein
MLKESFVRFESEAMGGETDATCSGCIRLIFLWGYGGLSLVSIGALTGKLQLSLSTAVLHPINYVCLSLSFE